MVIQPLTHQKLTNIKEHQDIINKINELIANNIEFPALIPNTYLHVNSEGLLEFTAIGEGGFVWGSGTGDIDDQEDLKEKFDSVGERIDGIEDEIGSDTESGTIRSDIKKNKDDIAALDSRVTTNEDAIVEIDEDIIDLENNKADKGAIKTAIASTLTDEDVVSGKAIYNSLSKVETITTTLTLPGYVTLNHLYVSKCGKVVNVWCDALNVSQATTGDVQIATGLPEPVTLGGAYMPSSMAIARVQVISGGKLMINATGAVTNGYPITFTYLASV